MISCSIKRWTCVYVHICGQTDVRMHVYFPHMVEESETQGIWWWST